MYRVISAIDTGFFLEGTLDRYDRNLIVKVKCDDDNSRPPSCKYESVCLAASKAIQRLYITEKNPEFWTWFSQNKDYIRGLMNFIIENPSDFNGSMCGGALEKLILWGIAAKKNVTLHYWSSSLNRKNIIQSISLVIDEVKDFDAAQLYNSVTFSIRTFPEKGILFIPKSPTYSLVDCILLQYDKDSKSKQKHVLYLFQITINIKDHTKGDKEIHSKVRERNQIDCKHNICQVNFY